jgi:hypothetical protein
MEEKLEQQQTAFGDRPRARLEHLCRRYNGPRDIGKKVPELVFVNDLDGRYVEVWKQSGPANAKDTWYEMIERRSP